MALILKTQGIQEGDRFITFHPGANRLSKRWRPENFASLANLINKKYPNLKILITGTEEDLNLSNKIASLTKEKPIILTGKTDLKELGAILEKSKLLICGDTGPLHIALAVKTPVISLFGSTDPKLTGPYGKGRYKVIQKDVFCRKSLPCLLSDSCQDLICMDAITSLEAFRTIEEFLSLEIRGQVLTFDI